AFDAERIPLGPQSLCRAMRAASHALDVEHDSRLLLYRIFDRHVMASYSRALERLNELLDHEGILAGLTYVPMRIRATPVDDARDAGDGEADGDAASPAQAAGSRRQGGARSGGNGSDAGGGGDGNTGGKEGAGGARRRGSTQRPHTAWMGEPAEPLDEDEQAATEKLLQLLAGRRELLGKLRPGSTVAPQHQLSTSDVFSALGHLQAQPLSAAGAPQSLTDIKQTLLAQARQRRGAGADLSPQDND